MEENLKTRQPLVSVVITCFNQAGYLADAVASIQRQTYQNVDIVIVDDGSTDQTREVSASFAGARYIYQRNSGLSAARNRGIVESRGQYLVFLDADDFLYDDGIETNLRYLEADPSLGMISGWHDKVDEWGYPLDEQDPLELVRQDHYRRLLTGNFIGMHAAVMYPRWVFNYLRFDTGLKACEDYDLYLRLAREFPVDSHSGKIAAYRIHGNNMSANIVLMYHSVLNVCRRQRPLLRTRTERAAYRTGIRSWRSYYAGRLFHWLWNELEKKLSWPPRAEMKILARELPRKLLAFVIKKARFTARYWLRSHLPEAALRLSHEMGLYSEYTPPPGKIKPGDFNRVTPFSQDFGFDRGGAIDRFYIERFIEEHAPSIRGTVLEIGDNEYTLKYGNDLVKMSDILHIDHSNAKATYIGDITDVPQIPSARFDCIIFTQTLHLIYDFKSALHTCYRILKPGGSLLLTVPGISNIDRGAWKDYWLWSFTGASVKKVMEETFNGSAVDVRTYGNVYAAATFLYGMGLPEVNRDFLLHDDPSYPVIISVKAVKH